MSNKRIYQLLAICQKGRNIISGEFSVKQAVLSQEAYLVIVTEDASENTKKFFKDKCAYRKIPQLIWGSRDEMGMILGKADRVAVAVLDVKLAEKVKNMIENDGVVN
ncbi:MAG: ribosomal L7Ae/L30e/S12e/Gadd45 family protein [Cellulosilyticaceae bacterium]